MRSDPQCEGAPLELEEASLRSPLYPLCSTALTELLRYRCGFSSHSIMPFASLCDITVVLFTQWVVSFAFPFPPREHEYNTPPPRSWRCIGPASFSTWQQAHCWGLKGEAQSSMITNEGPKALRCKNSHRVFIAVTESFDEISHTKQHSGLGLEFLDKILATTRPWNIKKGLQWWRFLYSALI